MNQITNKTLAELEVEYAKWGEFLNGGVGILAFSFGISCLGTPRPDITGFLSLAFLLLFSSHGSKYFPQKLKALRKSELKGIDEVALIGIEKKYFGLRALLNNFPVYLVGWLFLGCVALFGILKHSGKLKIAKLFCAMENEMLELDRVRRASTSS